MRACLTLLIIAGHLVAQAAALHGHADDSHFEQASLAHVHLSWFSDELAPHSDGQHCHDFATTDETAGTFSESATHDLDAVYVAAVTVASQSANQLRVLPFLAWDTSATLCDSSLLGCSVPPTFDEYGACCCADAPLYHCALFLQLQTLRI